MKGILRSFALVTLAVAVVCAVTPAEAQEATGGLRYSITVTKFENNAERFKTFGYRYTTKPSRDVYLF